MVKGGFQEQMLEGGLICVVAGLLYTISYSNIQVNVTYQLRLALESYSEPQLKAADERDGQQDSG